MTSPIDAQRFTIATTSGTVDTCFLRNLGGSLRATVTLTARQHACVINTSRTGESFIIAAGESVLTGFGLETGEWVGVRSAEDGQQASLDIKILESAHLT